MLEIYYPDTVYSAPASDEKGMKPEYSKYGVQPNNADYAVMEKIAEPFIRNVVRKN